ncbi:MAG: SRPBCC domain-containing protein [Acidobacteriota bacterium]|nr:SRPBCC domain-containing protein [Acidobacteriota bacterium]
MISAPASIEDATISITQETRVRASLELTFAALLEQLGPGNDKPDGTAMPMTLETFPGGRWFRDLGESNGHFWGNVQAIKSPTLLELSGPLFMSAPVINNVQYRLTEDGGETVIHFRHTGFGLVPKEIAANIHAGWSRISEQARKHAEATNA